ncbi:hypothetical protein Hypma_013278 [Hypsizygus marmoreus]|uniref:Uncharacterized protein n=1 Tax=Hypsizygus marmoreus TaxID=39966 RepID=A0A369JGD1_HYPMA|nr:hypothetical protein Hypma_013278 [Hypsizygus marmoreus]
MVTYPGPPPQSPVVGAFAYSRNMARAIPDRIPTIFAPRTLRRVSARVLRGQQVRWINRGRMLPHQRRPLNERSVLTLSPLHISTT